MGEPSKDGEGQADPWGSALPDNIRKARVRLTELLTTHSQDLAAIEEAARDCLDGGCDLAFPCGPSQLSPLEMAVAEELNDVVNLLLEKKLAEVDVITGFSCTCLCKACYALAENTGLIKILLYHGADPNATISGDNTGASCLITAVIHGRVEIVELLLDYGANIYYEWKGQNALSMAIDFKRADIVDMMENHEYTRAQRNRIERYTEKKAKETEGGAVVAERKDDIEKLPLQDGGVDFGRSLGDQSIMTSTFAKDLKEVDWIYSLDSLDIGKPLGSGGFGDVFVATFKASGDRVAYKQISCVDEKQVESFKQELKLLSKFRHENIVLFLGAVVELPRLGIITELMAGNLFDRLHERTKLSWEIRLRWARDVAKGMNYLHTRTPPVIHRDLKSMNVLLDDYSKAKLCDFGLSRTRNHTYVTTRHLGGSPAWMAPETLRGDDFDDRSDVFSFGVILWELATRATPWPDKGMPQLVGLVGFSRRLLEFPNPLPRGCPNLLPDLAQECWSEPEDRPSFKAIVGRVEQLVAECREKGL